MKALEGPLEALIAACPVLLLQFGDGECGPCHAIRHRLDRWLEGHKGIDARYVEVKGHPEVCAGLGIFSVPTVLVYMDGHVTERESGYFSLDGMLERLERKMEMRACCFSETSTKA